MTTTSTAQQRQTELAGTDGDGTKTLGSNVDELECNAMARYGNLRALGDAVKLAARWADARARLDAALARQA